MPDREMTPLETKHFITETRSGKAFDALHIVYNANEKPSIHDLCILELMSALEAQKRIVVNQGVDIKALQDAVDMLLARAKKT